MGTCFGLCKRRSKSKRKYRMHRCVYSHGRDEIELELLVDGETEEGEDFRSSKNVWMTGRKISNIHQSSEIFSKLLCQENQCLIQSAIKTAYDGPNSSNRPALRIQPLFKFTLYQQGCGVSSDLRNVRHYLENETKVDEKEIDYVGESQLIPLDAHTLLASRAVQKRTTSFSSSTPPSSIDLEWETEGALLSTVYRFKSLPSSSMDDGSSCSGGGGGGVGAGGSPESLEWDPCEQANMDFETEQLINEIEQLTHKALEETGDWSNR